MNIAVTYQVDHVCLSFLHPSVVPSFLLSHFAFSSGSKRIFKVTIHDNVIKLLYSYYGHIGDVHVTFWKHQNIFRKFTVMLNLVIFPACFE
jgi:hypothetical protein